jgi:hypothetical protein
MGYYQFLYLTIDYYLNVPSTVSINYAHPLELLKKDTVYDHGNKI